MMSQSTSTSAGASAIKAVGTPEMVTTETLKLMVLLVEEELGRGLVKRVSAFCRRKPSGKTTLR